MTPDERVGLRQAIANDPGTMSWPSKTVSELLDDIDRLTADVETSGAEQRIRDYIDGIWAGDENELIAQIGESADYATFTVADLHEVLRQLAATRGQLAGLTEEWAFQYVSDGVTETSLVCESREEAERESGQHRRGDRIVRRLCGEWEPVDGSADGAS